MDNETQKPCPNCGHCPTCGHTPYRTLPRHPTHPWYPAMPVYHPEPALPYITWGDSTGGTTTGGGESLATC